ncbi:MAG: hypothetical protein GY710_26420 [Desulfobacteraceae bacterium]|nr:hypothetical protein [Desulfobacteraceae bacterium]
MLKSYYIICISLLLILPGCKNDNADLIKNIKSVGVTMVAIDLRMDRMTNGTHYSRNLSPDEGLVSWLSTEETRLLDETILKFIENTQKKIGIKVVTPDLGLVREEAIKEKEDIHAYIPSGHFNLDIADKQRYGEINQQMGTDAIGAIHIKFVRIQYDQPFSGRYSKIQCKAKVGFYDQSGNEIWTTEVIGESQAIKEDSIVDFVMGTEKATGIKGYYSLSGVFGPLFKEALSNLSNLQGV